MPVLVDTSIWSLLFRRDQEKLNARERQAVDDLRSLVADKRIRVIGPIRQELLSGIRNTDQFERLQHRLRDFPDEPLTTADYEFAAQISCKCRAMGISPSAIDMLICSAANLRGWEIFTFDEDFKQYRRALPLRLYEPS
jgi:predicted nucleic acid-binding protein